MSSCCCPIYEYDHPTDGVCPDCGEPTWDGEAVDGCEYSPVVCKTCKHSPCDDNC